MFNARVLVLTGAGVSAESGIPTFRGKDGYWRNLDPAKLATPEAFAKDPGLVWEWYRERRERIRAAQPNAAHKAIAKLAQHAREFLLVTQNVDDLHARAGLPKEKMVQIHGDIFVTRCSRCNLSRHDHEHEHEREHIDIPRCSAMQCAHAARGCLVRRRITVGRTPAGRELFGGRPLRFCNRSRNNYHVWVHRRLGAARHRQRWRTNRGESSRNAVVGIRDATDARASCDRVAAIGRSVNRATAEIVGQPHRLPNL